MDNQTELTKEQLQYKNEQLARGVAFEELVRSKGFEHVKAYIENKIRMFTNQAIINGFNSMEEYREKKGEVNGLRELLQNIEADIEALKHETDKQPTK